MKQAKQAKQAMSLLNITGIESGIYFRTPDTRYLVESKQDGGRRRADPTN